MHLFISSSFFTGKLLAFPFPAREGTQKRTFSLRPSIRNWRKYKGTEEGEKEEEEEEEVERQELPGCQNTRTFFTHKKRTDRAEKLSKSRTFAVVLWIGSAHNV